MDAADWTMGDSRKPRDQPQSQGSSHVATMGRTVAAVMADDHTGCRNRD